MHLWTSSLKGTYRYGIFMLMSIGWELIELQHVQGPFAFALENFYTHSITIKQLQAHRDGS